MDGGTKKVPFAEGIWTTESNGEMKLLGSKCPCRTPNAP